MGFARRSYAEYRLRRADLWAAEVAVGAARGSTLARYAERAFPEVTE